MSNPSFLLLYVDSPKVSGAFYRELLKLEPVEQSPTFVLFALESGLMLGLWSRYKVEPATAGSAGASELAFTVKDAADVDATHAVWVEGGVRIAQAPVDLDFGRTFVGLDPDGHRLRVFAPAAA